MKEKLTRKVHDLKFRFLTYLNVKLGYVDNCGEPLKCYNCNSKNVEDYDLYHLDGYGSTLIEYSVKCKECGRYLGTWSCGSWNTFLRMED